VKTLTIVNTVLAIMLGVMLLVTGIQSQNKPPPQLTTMDTSALEKRLEVFEKLQDANTKNLENINNRIDDLYKLLINTKK
jgi:hypothetical protein